MAQAHTGGVSEGIIFKSEYLLKTYTSVTDKN